MNAEPTHWQVEVSKLLLRLAQEIHALNPGVRFMANLDLLHAYVTWAEEAQAQAKGEKP